MAYTIGVLKCCQDIIFIGTVGALVTSVVNSDRKFWPAAQKFLDIDPSGAVKIDREAEWRGKGELTPSSAYVRESVPVPCAVMESMSPGKDSIGIEYLEQYIVGEHVDHCVSVTVAYTAYQCLPQYTM